MKVIHGLGKTRLILDDERRSTVRARRTAMTATPITAAQAKQFRRFLEDAGDDALDEVCPDKDGLQRLFTRGSEFQAHIVNGIRRFTAKPTNYDLAKNTKSLAEVMRETLLEVKAPAGFDEYSAELLRHRLYQTDPGVLESPENQWPQKSGG